MSSSTFLPATIIILNGDGSAHCCGQLDRNRNVRRRINPRLGATGIAIVYDVTSHVRGEAGDRQIPGAKVGLTHVIGLGSACGIHILEKATI